jgi:hypothetical protein
MAQATSVPSSTVARACRPWNGAATAGVDSAWDCGPCGAVMRPPCGLMAFSNSERPSRSLKGIYLLRSPAEPSGSAKSRQVAMPAIGLLYGATPHASARAATCINGRVNALGVWSAPPAHHNAADLSVQERRCSDQRSIFVSGSCRSGCLAHRRS